MTRSTTKAYGYNVATNTLGMDHSAPLASTTGLLPHCPTMSMLGGIGGQSDRDRDYP